MLNKIFWHILVLMYAYSIYQLSVFCECMLLTIFSGDKSTKYCPAISADNIGPFIFNTMLQLTSLDVCLILSVTWHASLTQKPLNKI